MLNLPTPDDARQPAVSERDFAELHRDRDGARPMPEGETVIRVSLDDVMPAGSRQGS